MPEKITEPQKKFLRNAIIISFVGLAAFFLGDLWNAPSLFTVGLAVDIFGLSLLSQVWFHLSWVNPSEK